MDIKVLKNSYRSFKTPPNWLSSHEHLSVKAASLVGNDQRKLSELLKLLHWYKSEYGKTNLEFPGNDMLLDFLRTSINKGKSFDDAIKQMYVIFGDAFKKLDSK